MIKSKYVIFLIAILAIYININLRMYGEELYKPDFVVANDVIDYYAYLPAAFIYGDISLRFKEGNDFFNDKIWGFKQENGKYVLKYTMGLSLMYLPFFLLSHSYAMLSEHPTDGYSSPYEVGLIIATLFYFILGLIFLRLFLKKYFSDNIIAAVLLIISLATNITHYLVYEPAISHSFNFFLMCLFIYLTDKWHKNNKIGTAIFIGLTMGLISLIRPTNIIIGLLFLLWNVNSFIAIKEKAYLFIKHYKSLIIIAFFTFLIWTPQFLYWHSVTGHFLFYSYNNEGFFFLKPKIFHVLLGFRKGWLIYTPVMFFALFGIWTIYKTHNKWFFSILTFVVLNIYIISSWWCWWYGGSYGSRVFIESYAVMALPLSAFIKWIVEKNPKWYLFILVTIFIFSFHNLFQNKKYKNNSIHYDSMTRLAYFETIDKTLPTHLYYKLLITPDYENALAGKPERWGAQMNNEDMSQMQDLSFSVLHYNNFSKTNEEPSYSYEFINNEVFRTGGASYKLNSQDIYSPGFFINLKELHAMNIKWVLVEFYFYPYLQTSQHPACIVLSFENHQNAFSYNQEQFNNDNQIAETWNYKQLLVKVPEINDSVNDILKCYIWNIDGKSRALIDDFRVSGIVVN